MRPAVEVARGVVTVPVAWRTPLVALSVALVGRAAGIRQEEVRWGGPLMRGRSSTLLLLRVRTGVGLRAGHALEGGRGVARCG